MKNSVGISVHYIINFLLSFLYKQKIMEAIRAVQFIVTGSRNFTKWKQPLPPLQGDLKGLNYVITGANSGIGFQAAKQAAQKHANVYLVCRNKQRGQQAVNAIKNETKNENVFLILGEIGQIQDMNSIQKQLKEKINKIDILVHNAGCMLHKLQYNNCKIEKNFAANTFGVYYLTKLLLDMLHPKSKTITVSSGGMLTKPLETENLYMENTTFDGTKQYAKNKRQQVVMMEYFAKKFEDKGKFVSMHPGWVDTDAVRTAMPDFHNYYKNDLRPLEQGSDTITYLSLLPFEKIENGAFYFDRVPAQKHLTISRTSYEQKDIVRLIEKLQQLSKF